MKRAQAWLDRHMDEMGQVLVLPGALAVVLALFLCGLAFLFGRMF